MKKRLIIAGLLGLELVSLPAAAQMVDHVVFTAPQKAITVPLPSEPGKASFIIMSNAPFTITAKDIVGDFNVSVTAEGMVNDNPFGANAQMPGDATRCASVLTQAESAIYRATKKTAARPGEILTQAVRVDVTYDKNITPTFDVQTEKESRNVPRAAPCASASS